DDEEVDHRQGRAQEDGQQARRGQQRGGRRAVSGGRGWGRGDGGRNLGIAHVIQDRGSLRLVPELSYPGTGATWQPPEDCGRLDPMSASLTVGSTPVKPATTRPGATVHPGIADPGAA